jgi:superfamily II DNA or RNA helicase
MSDAFAELFGAVREACKPAQWSRGIELARGGSVFLDRRDDEEAVFRIASGSSPVARTVSLYLDDGTWDCGCGSPGDACEHVAAAVITWKRASEQGLDVVEAARPADRVGYRFRRVEGGLALERVLETPQGTRPLEGTLAGTAVRERGAGAVAIGQADLAVELALGTHRRGLLPPGIVDRVFARLAHCTDIRLDGAPVGVSPAPVLPSVRVEDQGEGFRLALVDDPDLLETFGNGIALCGNTLRPIGQAALTGRELHELPRGKRYGPDQVAELVTEVLPALRRRVAVDVRTERLPETVSEPPRVEFDTSRDGERLSVLAVLVYGDPPRARIDAGRLVHLRGAVPERDPAAERRVARDLERDLQLALGVRAEFDGEQAVEFARRLERWQGRPARGALAHFHLAPPLEPRLSVEDGDFDVRFVSAAGSSGGAGAGADRLADPRRVLRAWREGESLVPLLEGGFAPLPRDWLERHGHRLADLLAAREVAGALPPSLGPDLARLVEDLDQPLPPRLEAVASLARSFAGVPAADLPPDLTATLRHYQREGVDWLVFLRGAGLGALLADDMGLGKTLQALCGLGLRGRALVVAPTSVLHNWADEIRRFRPALRAAVYHGAGRKLDPAADVTLTTYAILRLDVELLAAERWDTVVLDEAQAIKNPESQVASAAFRLQAEARVALTGTPVENRLDELWSQMHFLNRGLLGGRSDFQERYAQPIASGDAEAARRLRERIRPFLLRRLKRDVAPELPPRTDVVLRCELSPLEREVYETIRAATVEDVVRRLAEGGSVLAALEALLRLRQAACHPALVPGQTAAGSSKVELLLEQLDSVVAEGHKAIVFSQWTSLLDLLEPPLERAGIVFARLDGSTRDRAGVVARFQSAAGPPVMLVSLKAGGTGLNLTAADHVFLLDPWWNPAVEDQAADRAHRIGQERPVLVYRLVAEATVEERILALQASKRAIADAALGQAEGAAAGLTRDDLFELLRS